MLKEIRYHEFNELGPSKKPNTECLTYWIIKNITHGFGALPNKWSV